MESTKKTIFSETPAKLNLLSGDFMPFSESRSPTIDIGIPMTGRTSP